MALVKKLGLVKMERNVVHKEVDCTYSVFTDSSGAKYFQIDTYGSPQRKLKGKKSQSIQFNRKSLAQLKDIIEAVL